MSEALESEIVKLAEAHLPAATAGAMKRYIEEAEALQKEIARIKAAHEIARDEANRRGEEIALLKKELARAGDLDQWETVLNGREEAVSDRERNIELEVMKIKLEEAEKRSDKAVDLVNRFLVIRQ